MGKQRNRAQKGDHIFTLIISPNHSFSTFILLAGIILKLRGTMFSVQLFLIYVSSTQVDFQSK